MRRAMMVGAIAALVLASGACSKDTATTTGSGASSTTAAPTTSTQRTSPGTSAAPGTTQKPGCTTALRITNAKAADDPSVTDRTLDVKTAWSDQGPHPDNTVDMDTVLEVALAEYVIPKDPQFGYSIPVGVPDVGAGKAFISFRLSLANGKIAAGQTFVDSTSDLKGDGQLMSYLFQVGSTRLLPGSATVKITELTDDHVCGSIASTTKTDLQSFVGVEGTFELTRIQSLEAQDK